MPLTLAYISIESFHSPTRAFLHLSLIVGPDEASNRRVLSVVMLSRCPPSASVTYQLSQPVTGSTHCLHSSALNRLTG